MNWMRSLTTFFACLSLMVTRATALDDGMSVIIDRPENHIWDRDDLFRSHPEYLPQLSQIMKDLEEEDEMEVYLVIHSSSIGEKPVPFSRRCHAAWVGEKNDGLVFVLSFNETMGGAIGRSDSLYNGHFLEEGIMPRINYSYLEGMLVKAFAEAQKEEAEVDQVRSFFDLVSKNLKERLAAVKAESASRESYHFMGWMALALLVCAVAMGLLSKVMGSVGKRANQSFRFPDFKVAHRLKASNGGGKISVVDFERKS